MRMSPPSRCGTTSAIVVSTTPAGTINQTARGFSSLLTRSATDKAPIAPSFAKSWTAFCDTSKTTH